MHALYANINVTARLIYMKILTVSEYHHLHTLKLNPKLGLVFPSSSFFKTEFWTNGGADLFKNNDT